MALIILVELKGKPHEETSRNWPLIHQRIHHGLDIATNVSVRLQLGLDGVEEEKVPAHLVALCTLLLNQD